MIGLQKPYKRFNKALQKISSFIHFLLDFYKKKEKKNNFYIKNVLPMSYPCWLNRTIAIIKGMYK